MAKSLKSLLRKINLVDIAVVLVLIAVMICLMKKMNVVGGLCLGKLEENDEKCKMRDDEELCEDRTTCRWISEDLVETEQGQPEGLQLPRLEIPGVEQVGNCILNYRALQEFGFQKSHVNNERFPIVITCSENADNDCDSIPFRYRLRGACCIEDPNDPGECM